MTANLLRRWFRYSLRTMFVVVTVFAVWLGWELKFVNARRNFPGTALMSRETEEGQHPPFWRRWLGDEAVSAWYFPNNAPDDLLSRARELFPESRIIRLTESEEETWFPPREATQN